MLGIFQRSLASLELTDIPPLASVVVEVAPIVTKNNESVQPVIDESPNGSSVQLSVYRQGPRRQASREMTNVLEKFSLVTKFARVTTVHLFEEIRFLGNSEIILNRTPKRSGS